jgi:protein SCO1/2
MSNTKTTEAPLAQETECVQKRVILRSPTHKFQSKRFQGRRKPLAQWIRHRISICVAIVFVCCCHCSQAAQPSPLQPETLASLRFRQNLDTIIPLDQTFRDESGQTIRFRDCLHKQPAILVLGYYECPMLCNAVLNGLLNGLNDLKRTTGKDFDLIFVSIDPKETPRLAAAKRASYLRHYDRPGSEVGWHFLTGDEPSIRSLSDVAGFQYAYEPASKQYAHPAGVLILTSEGRISKYLFGVSYPPSEINAALTAASQKQIGNPIQELFMLCFHYNPITGKYGALIMVMVRVAGLLTIAGLAALIIRTARRKEPRALDHAPGSFPPAKQEIPAP